MSEITRKELEKYYGLSLEHTASELKLGTTALKKICRDNGISRWPHRKLRSIDKLIDQYNKLEASCGLTNKPKTFDLNVNNLLEKRNQLLNNPNIPYRKLIPKYISNYVKNHVKNIEHRPTKEIKKKQADNSKRGKLNIPKNRKYITNYKDFLDEIPIFYSRVELVPKENILCRFPQMVKMPKI